MILPDNPTDKELLKYVDEFLDWKDLSMTAPAARIALALKARVQTPKKEPRT